MPSDIAKTFGERLFAIRKRRALSQREVAERIGTSAPIIGRYERGDIAPSIEVATRLAGALDASLDYLSGLSEQAQLDSQMLGRLDAIERLPEDERKHVFFALDAMLRDSHARRAYGV